MKNFWPDCERVLQQELPPQQFATWIRPLTFIEFDEGQECVRLSAPNRVKLDWVQKQFAGRIESLVQQFWGGSARVSFEVAARAAARPAPSALPPKSPESEHNPWSAQMGAAALQRNLQRTPTSKLTPTAPTGTLAGRAGSTNPPQSAAFNSALQAPGIALEPRRALNENPAPPEPRHDANEISDRLPSAPEPVAEVDTTPDDTASKLVPSDNPLHPQPLPHQERARLNPTWTFDTFVIGKANQLARAAALQVAENPGIGYNPLFLYGGVGLGKSHLIHAVGNALVSRDAHAKVRYIHAETYVSDVVRAYQRKSFDDFKRYYHSLDLLLIDDIQFFSGKSRTQEEFFYAFEALIAARKQIIITSDTYPKELGGIDDRLISRFDSGLTVAIEPPELEMRVAILLKKAELQGVELGEEPAFFVAKHLRSNVRELEGALLKIIAFARFNNVPITLETVKTALKDVLNLQKTLISVEGIQKTVADYYKIKIADMYSKRRPANIALPRQIAMYLAKELTQKSLPEIGELFGGRDHTTVLHAVKKISESRQRNAELNHQLHVLEQTLRT